MKTAHGDQHLFRLGSSVMIPTLCPTIDNRVEHVGVWEKIAMTDRIGLMQLNHVGKKS
jgi:hypothetical protein